ncbi:MAG: hypothetical protein AAFX50_06745, partial [Acidobacteriota bacterium]
LLIAAGPHAVPTLTHLVNAWIHSYDLLVRIPILEDPNPDGLRSTDPVFQREVDARLMAEIDGRGLHVLDLTGVDRDRWVDRVEVAALESLRPAQLSLPER